MDGTMADVIREALSVFWWLAKEYRQGSRLMIQRGDSITELMIPSLERLKSDAGQAGEAEAMPMTIEVPGEPAEGRG
jgi:hypothetical protein